MRILMGTSEKVGLLERLEKGVVIGDGGFLFNLESRGYVRVGNWTPEVLIENPEAVIQLHREFLRSGSDVMQAFTFNTSKFTEICTENGDYVSKDELSETACSLAKKVASEGGALLAGGLNESEKTNDKKTESEIKQEFQDLLEIYVRCGVDFLICEFFSEIEEMEWAIDVCKKFDLPVCATMNIATCGDKSGVSTGECAVRMSKAGADVVGQNCSFGIETCLKTMEMMKAALDAADLHPFLMCQPAVWHVPDGDPVLGLYSLPEHPLAMEPRVSTRIEVHDFARRAYDIGVRYIGGCCGFQPYHIRAIAEELANIRGYYPKASFKSANWGESLKNTRKTLQDSVSHKFDKLFWTGMEPATGRPRSAAFAQPYTDK